MIIITWNANAVNRWAQLWGDPLVVNLPWDVICLQEVGNPRPEWNQISGKPWGANTIEEFLIRKYWYQTPFGLIVYITHCEWTHRQKNHLVTITRALPNWVTDLSGSMGERPCLGLKARLHFIWPHHHTIDVLIGCVHIIATPTKAPTETKEMIKFVDDMNGYTNTNGWILCGDFNADPQVTGQVTNRSVQWAPTWSQINQQQYPIDYLVSSTPAVTNAPFNGWQTGTAMSDHRLMAFIQQFGPVVQIL